MQNNKLIYRALRLLKEDKGRREAELLLMAQGISASTAQKLVRRKYKIKPGGLLHRAIKPVLDAYIEGAS